MSTDAKPGTVTPSDAVEWVRSALQRDGEAGAFGNPQREQFLCAAAGAVTARTEWRVEYNVPTDGTAWEFYCVVHDGGQDETRAWVEETNRKHEEIDRERADVHARLGITTARYRLATRVVVEVASGWEPVPPGALR